MKNYLLKPLCLLCLAVTTLFSCKGDDDISIPDITIVTPPGLEPNANLTTIKKLYREGEVIEFNTTQNGGKLITSGFIISNDALKNINNMIYLQDKVENPESGVVIDVIKEGIYLTHGLGRNLIIKLNGLGMKKINNELHIGVYKDGDITPMTNYQFNDHVFRTSTKEEIIPKKVTVEDILKAASSTNPDAQLSTILVTIENIQIINEELSLSYANSDNDEFVTRSLISCDENKIISLKNSGLSLFKALQIPIEKGTITGILSKDVLTIRSVLDINFTGSRCGTGIETGTNITIKNVRDVATGETLVKFDDIVFKDAQGKDPVFTGYMISSDQQKSTENKLYLQSNSINPNAGIIVDFVSPQLFETYPIGKKVSINLKGLGMQQIDGNLHIGKINAAGNAIAPITPNQDVFNKVIVASKTPVIPITPTVVTAETINDQVPLTLVRLDNMQVITDHQGQPYNGDKQLFNCNTKKRIPLKTSAGADFIGATLPIKKGSITAIFAQDAATTPYLKIRNATDLDFTAAPCLEKDILIEEGFQSITDVGFFIALSGWNNSNSSHINKWKSNSNGTNIFAEIKSESPASQYDAWLITEELTINPDRRALKISMDIMVSEFDLNSLEVFIVNSISGNDISTGASISINIPQENTAMVTKVADFDIPQNQNTTFRIGFRYRKQVNATTDYQIDNIKVVER